MKKPPNLQQKLFDSGLIEKGDLQEIEAFKKKYKANYTQQYYRNHKENTYLKRLSFTKQEMENLKDLARQYDMPLATLLKASIFAYHQGIYIPLDSQDISQIEKLLREINLRITESVQYVHLSSEVRLKDIETLKKTVFELEKSIAQKLHHPPRLEIWIDNHQKKDPLFVSKLLESIAKFLNQNHDY